MKSRSLKATAIAYAISFILLVLLIEALWGVTGGVLIGASMGTDKATQEEVSRILKEKGIEAPKRPDADWYDKLPSDVKRDIQNAVKKKLTTINWFAVTLGVSIFVFAVVSFLCGFFNRAFIPIGLLVVLSFLVNNPVVRFPHAKALGSQQKIVIVIAQFAICYLFGYLGASLGRKRDKKRLEISVSNA